LAILLLLCSCGGGSIDLDKSETDEQPVEPVAVKSITVIRDRDRNLDWSHANNLITYSYLDTDGYYDVAVMNPDGSGSTCLTCDNPALPNKHMSNPTWHPSGNYLVFQVEKTVHYGDSFYSTPGIGYNCNLWAMTSDGGQFFQLTDLVTKQGPLDPNPTTGVLHPHFSNDGTKLVWGQLVQAIDGRMGDWELKVADVVIDGGAISLVNIQTFTPGQQTYWYESHGFSPDDTKIIFSGSLESGQDDTGMDIYTMDLETEELMQLTQTYTVWDEHAHCSPDGSKIVWISSVNDFDPTNWRSTMATEYFIMDADGSNKTQLTFFNTPGHPDNALFSGAMVICADSSWNADGDAIMASIAVNGQLYIIEIQLERQP
jgi:Tol biopolymer transport system component